ncbi:MAG: hypothetical protein AAF518_26010 [Spirochaetota bacterium]
MEKISKNILTSLWEEKIKLAQYVINTTAEFTIPQLGYTIPGDNWTVYSHLHHIVWIDRMMRFSVPFSILASSLFPFKSLGEPDYALELEKVSRLYQTPSIPPGLGEIYVFKASTLNLTGVKTQKLIQLYSKWKASLQIAENYLLKLSEEDCRKKRFFSAVGVYSLPAGIELHVAHTTHYLHNNILPALSNSEFLEKK